MARSLLGTHSTRTPVPTVPSPSKTVSTDGAGHRGEEGAWAGGPRHCWPGGAENQGGLETCHAVPKDTGTAKVPLLPWQTGPGMSLTRAPALAASCRLLLRLC